MSVTDSNITELSLELMSTPSIGFTSTVTSWNSPGASKDGINIQKSICFTFSRSYDTDSEIPFVTFEPSANAHHSHVEGDQGRSRIAVVGPLPMFVTSNVIKSGKPGVRDVGDSIR